MGRAGCQRFPLSVRNEGGVPMGRVEALEQGRIRDWRRDLGLVVRGRRRSGGCRVWGGSVGLRGGER